MVKITYDPAKRRWTLLNRDLDFFDAAQVFAGPKFTFEDERKNYGERRFVTIGLLNGRVVVIGWTPRVEGDLATHHVFSMRKANERETRRFNERLGGA